MAQPSAIFSSYLKPKSEVEEEEDRKLWNCYRELVSTWKTLVAEGMSLPYYKNQWPAPVWDVLGTVAADRHFKARDTDLLVATYPKSGTTWIKALLFAVVHCRGTRKQREDSALTLSGLNPHECVPVLESQVYTADKAIPDLDQVQISPRLFHTHIPLPSLPASVVPSGCRVVYLWRDPKDVIVSAWHFVNNNRSKEGCFDPVPLESIVASITNEISIFGSIWDHAIGYWQYSLMNPGRVLFLTYENLTKDAVGNVRKLAEFIHKPFTAEEEEEGVAQEIVQLCSIESLRKVKVNQSSSTSFGHTEFKNSTFFRSGKTGDWANNLSEEEAAKIDKITKEKFHAAGVQL